MSTLHQKTGMFYLAAFLIFTAGANILCAQSDEYKSKTPKFSIFINATKDGIAFTCTEGCNWKEVSFKNSDSKQIYALDQSGLRNITKSPNKRAAKKSTWLISIHRLDEQITLEGLKGTTWKNLTLKCPKFYCTESIDENGITQLN